MTVSKRTKEIASIIRNMQRQLGEMPRTEDIYNEVLRLDGDKSCSYRTITAAKQYLNDVDGLAVSPADVEHIGRSVLFEVSMLLSSEGAGVNLIAERKKSVAIVSEVICDLELIIENLGATGSETESLCSLLNDQIDKLKLVTNR